MNVADWSTRALDGVRQSIPPSLMHWEESGLFATYGLPSVQESDAAAQRAARFLERPTVFSKLARSVSCHNDASRWSKLYAALWRMVHGEPELLTIVTDPLVHQLVQMHRNVRRASHKMKAFVRFRLVERTEAYVAWFEPAHHVVERTAPFFARRFSSMRWSILTPDRCAHWDLERLTFTEGLTRASAPAEDVLEELWRTYYASIFNPARLNGRAMRAEMPMKYWENLPEARIIAELRANAPARVREMLKQSDSSPEPLPAELSWQGKSSNLIGSAPVRGAGIRLVLDEPGSDPVHDPGVSVAMERERRVLSGSWCRTHVNSTPIDFGVAGWTDPSLLVDGIFYPVGCNTAEMRLRYYASRFPMVEVDSTYYALPTRSTAAAWAARTPDDFTFDIKAHALMTGHPTDGRRLPDWVRRVLPRASTGTRRVYTNDLPAEIIDEVWTRFRSALDPLRTTGKLGAIMLQYPRWFEPTRQSADALRLARERLGDDLATVEFRNRAWMEGRIADRTLGLLRELGLSYVVVDAPPGMQSSMPPTVGITDERLVVFRLHGRRVETWEAKNDPVTERYRYLYDRDQLEFWRSRIYRAAMDVARVHVTFNNNHSNYATTNAAEMASLFAD